eukprot:1191917-Prorocentrum_minimum.AAC.1
MSPACYPSCDWRLVVGRRYPLSSRDWLLAAVDALFPHAVGWCWQLRLVSSHPHLSKRYFPSDLRDQVRLQVT